MSDSKAVKKREDIPAKYKWDLSLIYSDERQWEADIKEAERLAKEFTKYEGTLESSMETLAAAFAQQDQIWRLFEKAHVYARMKKDEDNTVDKYQSMSEKSLAAAARIGANLSFFTPELLKIDAQKLKDATEKVEGLKVYRHLIYDLIREKEHILSGAEEQLLAMYSEVTSAPRSIFRMINNADMKFDRLKDDDGDEVELTHGTYITLLESENRQVRCDAFKTMYRAFSKQKNTIASTYYYSVKADVISSKVRNYKSALEASLSSDNVPKSVYTNLIDTVNAGLPVLHRYVELRRKALGLSDVHMYDIYAPLTKASNRKIPYEEGLTIIREALKPLGSEYLEIMNNGFSSGWIDVYENAGKTSGAYSFGSYDTAPYILLNYQGRLKDVSTIAHEMGHSMHSYFTRKNQPFIYGGHSIFTAEVASTVNETLLMRHMINNCKDVKEKAYLLNTLIEEFRATFFRQTMFAEFEMLTHDAVENDEVLTCEWLSNAYGALNRKYFGDKVVYDDEISMEWARIPHFYNDFYVYKYATGYSAAIALSEKILTCGKSAQRDYIEFLKSGENDYPINLLVKAGVDMSSPKPIEDAIGMFNALVDEMEKLIG